MSDKALAEKIEQSGLTDKELEVTQRIQRSFPRGAISGEMLHHWNSCPKEELQMRTSLAYGQKSERPLVQYEVVPEYLPIWRRFRVGGLDKPQLRAELGKVSREVSEWGCKLFDHPDFQTSVEAKDIFFAKVTFRFLGFKKNPKTKDWLYPEFFTEWSKKHLQDGWVMELCEVEDGPSVGYQYTNQPNGEILWLAHEPLVVGGDAGVWGVERSDGGRLWLGAGDAFPGSEWGLDDGLLLRLRKI